jgi:serine/threonine-protein kinase
MSSGTSGPHAPARPTPDGAPHRASGGATHDPPEELRRALAGRFDVERLLGAGGMGSVYYGRDVTLDRPVAIKVVNPDVALAATVRERFLAEARTVARLRHPNVVAVYAAGEAGYPPEAGGSVLYFVMEYVPGESLRDRLTRDGRFDDGEALVALRDLARALGYAHAQGIVHRDVKPENVLLDAESGRAMLTDFGVAQALAAQQEGDGRLTGLGIVLGSPRYMSPEQAAGERQLDGRSDVYALGLVAYEMFAGEPAVTATSAPTILVKHLTEKPAPIATRSARVTPRVAAVIERALEKDPAQRWPTADAMADALDEALAAGDGGETAAVRSGAARAAARPYTATTGGTTAAATAPPRRRRALLAGAAAALVAAAGAGWWALGGGDGVPRGVDPRKSYVVAPFEVQSGDPQLTWLREGSVNMLALNLAQWRDLTVVDYERALDLLRDLGLDDARRLTAEDAQRLARRAGVWSVVTGVVTGTADSLFVTASLRDVASGDVVDQAQHAVARAADPRAIFDRIARDLLDVAGAPQTTVALAQSTTGSLEAYKAYLEASRALNGWQLARAESLYARATALDSTFALAHYRHALTLGWGAPGAEDQSAAIRAARRHAARLPARERGLLEAYDDLTAALRAQSAGDSTAEQARFVAAQQKYAAVVARDSGDAEAWYGLADALWHHRPGGWASPRAIPNWSAALRAFDRTLALDSSFHLAYSHKLDIYRVAADRGAAVVLDGDSLRAVPPEALGRDSAVVRAKRRAAELAVQEARHWAAADPVAQAHVALLRSYMGVGRPAQAVAALDTAFAEHPELRRGMLPFLRAQLVGRIRPADGVAAVREALRTATPDGIAAERGSDVFPLVMGAATVAAGGGSAGLVDSVAAVLAAARPTLPTGGAATIEAAPVTRWWAAVGKLAMGAPPASVRPALDAGIRFLERLPAPAGPVLRRQSLAGLYTLYLETREPRYLALLRAWDGPASTWTELDALEALARGDSARVRELARAFPSPDSVRAADRSTNAARWVARAQLFAELGDARGALRMYEVLDPKRFGEFGLVDPGPALYARSLLARARLYEETNDRAAAARDYQAFLTQWANADSAFQTPLGEARAGLARVRDAGRAATPVGVR